MKKDKEWLKKEVSENVLQYPVYYDEQDELLKKMVSYHEVITLIDHLDEPEKVAIPQFVADHIRRQKELTATLLQGIGVIKLSGTELINWITQDGNDVLFCKAWLDGYEVEKKKKYYVLNSHGKTILVKLFGKQIAPSQGRCVNDLGKHNSDYQFTEQEIKDYDERYWAFAEEVTE